MKRWTPYHFAIPLTEGEIPMDKGGFRTVTDKSCSSAMEAVVYCKDCKHGFRLDDTNYIVCGRPFASNRETHTEEWFCADGKMKEDE